MNLSTQHLKMLMRPLVRAFLRHSHSIHDFLALAKAAFVEIAEEEIQRAGQRPNISRLSAMTGLYRREVSQIFKKQGPPLYQGASLLARVMSRWESDKRFCNSNGKPRSLSFGEAKSEFSLLVESVSTDTHPGTILNELRRAGLVEISPRGASLRKREALVPGDVDRAVQIISQNLEICLRSGEENALHNPEPRNLHLRTTYDNIYVDKMPQIRAWVLEEGREFHRRLRAYLAEFDSDVGVNQEPGRETGGKIVVSSFSVAEDPGPKI